MPTQRIGRLPRFDPRRIDREEWDVVLGKIRVPVEEGEK